MTVNKLQMWVGTGNVLNSKLLLLGIGLKITLEHLQEPRKNQSSL